MSIKKKLLHGAIWNSLSQFGSQAINFLIIIVLARLLGPADFGLVGMVSVITSFLGYFTEFGLLASLIQKKQIDDGDIHTVYWSTLVFSCVTCIIVFYAAPLVSLFYGNPKLTLITRVLFANFLVSALAFVPEALQIKKLDYSKITIANLIGGVISGVIGITLAFFRFGVWSLIAQQISMNLFRGIVLIISTGWRPKAIFSYTKFKELISFGGHYAIRNLMLYLSENLDYLLVGKLLGPAALGVYTLAFRISKYAFLKLWAIFGTMLFPAFSAFSDDLDRVRKNYIKTSVAGGIVLTPVFIGLLFGLESLVALIFGAKWLPTIPIVKIFIAYLVVSGFSCADDSLMIALNLLKTLNLAKVVATCALLGLGYWWTVLYGLEGMAWAFSASSLGYMVAVKVMVFKKIKLGFGFYSACLAPVSVMIIALLATGAIYKVLCAGLGNRPIFFLGGEALVLGFVSIVVLVSFKIIDMRSRTFSIDAVLRAG